MELQQLPGNHQDEMCLSLQLEEPVAVALLWPKKLPKNHIKATIQYQHTKFAEIMTIQDNKIQKIPGHQAVHPIKTQVSNAGISTDAWNEIAFQFLLSFDKTKFFKTDF